MLHLLASTMVLATPPDAWRIMPATATGDMGDSWTVRELQLFASADCTGTRIRHASTISSSGSGGQADEITKGVPTYPDISGSWWQGSLGTSIQARSEWVGFIVMPGEEAHAGCVRLAQCASSGCAPRILLQSRTGGNSAPWVDVVEFDTVAYAWTEFTWAYPPAPPRSPPPPSSPPLLE